VIPQFAAIAAAIVLTGGALLWHDNQEPANPTAPASAAAAETDSGEEASSPASNLERYCDLTKRLVLRYFAEAQEGGAEPGQFLRENKAQLAELRDVAPAAIKADVATFVAGTSNAAAERRLQTFAKEHCPT
jgi:hypothetical protein